MTILQHYRCFPWAYFNGIAWTGVQDSLSLKVSKVTIEAFVNIPVLQQEVLLPIVLKGSGPWVDNKGYGIGVRDILGSNQIYMSVGTGTSWNWARWANYSSLVGDWHQITGTYDGNSLILYIDGIERATASLTGDIDPGTANVVVGTNLKVLVGIVRIYSRALTKQSIEHNLRNPYHPRKSGLVLWFDNRSMESTRWDDLSGNENKGTPNYVELKYQPQYLTNYKTLTNFKIPA
jgi:hypothetical protein